MLALLQQPQKEIKTGLLCTEGQKNLQFFLPSDSVHHPSLWLPKKRAPQRLPSAFLQLTWLCRLDPSPPAFNRGYENQAACSLFIFSDLLCVLPAAGAMAFPNTGHRSELRVHPGLMREVHKSVAKMSLCKRIKAEASPRFTVLAFKVLVIELKTCFSCCSEAGTSCWVGCSSGHRGFQRAWPSALQLHQSELWAQGPAAAGLCIGAISINLGHAVGMKLVVKESWWASAGERDWAAVYNGGKSPVCWKVAFSKCA